AGHQIGSQEQEDQHGVKPIGLGIIKTGVKPAEQPNRQDGECQPSGLADEIGGDERSRETGAVKPDETYQQDEGNRGQQKGVPDDQIGLSFKGFEPFYRSH
ncbi:unnamed protein product, partial [marine sediment metagenome]